MKNLFILLFICLSVLGFGQESMPEPTPDRYLTSFQKIGTNLYEMYKEDHAGIFGNPAKMRAKVIAKAKNFADNNNYDVQFVRHNIHPVGGFADWASYTYTFSLVNKLEALSITSSLSSEAYKKEIKSYLDTTRISSIEGIYDYVGTFRGNQYSLAIVKNGDKYVARVIESNNNRFPIKSKKATFEPTAMEGAYTIKWISGNGSDVAKTIAIQEGGVIKFSIQTEGGVQENLLYQMYPKGTVKRNINKSWTGNGSGLIISKSGFIITNNHVIEDADNIEVEFLVNNETQKYKAQLVQADKTNDLAIIKIVDVNFDGVTNIPFNFKTRSSDVGTKVYAYGYPMALTVMGKEVKVTDGIISSKTGFDGNITTYQITAPIQAGNSGGPLFDDKGNFIGINSSGIRKDVADNVAYSIKTSYVLNLIDILPRNIDLPSSTRLQSLPLTSQIKEISKYVVLIKVK